MKIKQISFLDKDFSNIRDIRKIVFADEMGIPEHELFDKFDQESDHFIFVEQNNVDVNYDQTFENNIKWLILLVIFNY